jgi:FAD/FMN-containing dehydrogenase
MKRRAFCTSTIATLGIAALPFGRGYTAVTSVNADVQSITGDGKPVTLSRSDVEDFRAGLRGQLLLPDAAGYDDARKIFNGMFDKRPALIARCAGEGDVVRSVNFARTHGLLVAVRGGGHSLSGQSVCDDGLMIDLSLMRDVRVNSERQRARVGGGALLGDVDRATLAVGLVTPTGTVSHTGAGGLTLGGGFGRLSRRFGLTCDQVMAVDIVTADGRLSLARADLQPELLWAVKGGGGNFGVVTSFEYRLHPFDGQAIGGHIVYSLDQARDVLRGYAHLYPQAPDDLWLEPFLTRTPTGDGVVTFDVCYTGPMDQAEAALAPYRRLGKARSDDVRQVPFTHLQTKDDKRARIGGHYYTKSGLVRTIDRDLIDVMIETIRGASVPRPRIALPPWGGAVARLPRDAAAFWHRDALCSVILQTSNDDRADDAANIAWVKAKWPALQKFTAGFYSNTNLSEMPADSIREAYGGNYDRLLALKNQYDPRNLFRLNANVKPRA